jgi:hypothetical protein
MRSCEPSVAFLTWEECCAAAKPSRAIGRSWDLDNYRTEADEFIDAGDAVIVVARLTARGRGSGAEFTNRIVLMYGLRDGKMTYLDAFRTKREVSKPRGCGSRRCRGRT